MAENNSNVIFYMRLMHELKAEFPNVPDEVVKDTVIKFGGDKYLCNKELSVHSSSLLSRSKRSVEEGKFSAQRGKNSQGPSSSSSVVVSSSSLIVSSSSSTVFTPSNGIGGVSSNEIHRRRPPKCISRTCRENPYSKVFARRKMFYQKFCEKDGSLEEDSRFFSSSNLVWRRKCSLCEEDRMHDESDDRNVITLNANIQPFAPFVIRHDSEGTTPGALSLLNSLNHLHLDSSGHSSMGSSLGANSSEKMEMSDGKVHYATSTINSEEGVESHLEVSLGKTESFITTTHTDLTNNNHLSNSSSSIFHLQYEEGGKVLNITSNFNSSPDPKRARKNNNNNSLGGNLHYSRPVSLNLNSSLFAPRPSSAYCTQLNNNNGVVSPRYNSLPNLNSHGVPHPYSCFYPEEYQYNPADEEKRLVYTRALLTHQMEQCFKLDQELRMERSKLNTIRDEIALMEEKRNKKRLIKMNAQARRNEGLEKDIKSLRYSCDTLAAKVTKITKGKIPLGEISLEFYQCLSPKLSDSNKKYESIVKDSKQPFDDLSKFISALDQKKASKGSSLAQQPLFSNSHNAVSDSSFSSGASASDQGQWACTECTFLNHPALNVCEGCEMPRFALGLSNPTSNKDSGEVGLGTSPIYLGENTPS